MTRAERVCPFVLAAIAGVLLARGLAPESRAAAPQQDAQRREERPALVKVRYLAGRGEEFTVQESAGVEAVMAWLEKAESGPMSEHERIGLCDREAEMYLFTSAQDTMPSRTVFLFIGCHHVSGHVVKAEQFAELRKLLSEAGTGTAPPPAAGAAADESRLVSQLGDAKLGDAALAELVKLGRVAQCPPATRGPIELTAFTDAVWRMPTLDQATPLIVGVRVANVGKEAEEFWPAELQPVIRWGDGQATVVGENSNVSALPRPIQLGAGESRRFLIQGARLAYLGTPKYLAFYGNAFRAGAVYELALKGTPKEAGLAFQYAHAKPRWLRTDEIKCRVEAQPLPPKGPLE